MKEYKARERYGVPAEDLWSALTNPFALGLWTGGAVTFEAAAGTPLSLFDGEIEGRVLEVRTGHMMRQRWFFGDEELPDDHPETSIVTLHVNALSQQRCELAVAHTGIPDEAFDNMAEGWRDVVLPSLRDFLEAPE